MEFIRYMRQLKTYTFSIRGLSTCSRRYCASSRMKKKQVHADTPTPVINQKTINKLEQLSLITFNSDYSFSVLEGAINFTEHLRVAKIDDKIEPMYSPIENEFIPLRDDQIKNNATRKEILKNAVLLDEEYFVTPLNKNTSDSS